jgi:hypothetical protein
LGGKNTGHLPLSSRGGDCRKLVQTGPGVLIAPQEDDFREPIMRGAGWAAAVVIAVLGLGLAAGARAAHACEAAVTLTYDEPVELEGVLVSGNEHREPQGELRYVFLALDQKICVAAPKSAGGGAPTEGGTAEAVDRIQMAGAASEKWLPIGERVLVKGTLFAAHTMRDVEDVLIDATAVEVR